MRAMTPGSARPRASNFSSAVALIREEGVAFVLRILDAEAMKIGTVLPDDGGGRGQPLPARIEVVSLGQERHIASDQLLRLRQRRRADRQADRDADHQRPNEFCKHHRPPFCRKLGIASLPFSVSMRHRCVG
jgi:hypothetical protein